MKNLKKALCLLVASLMVFGLIATAAGTGYADVADGTPTAEAVKVLSALNIIKGDDKGNFNPTATITRAEMAKIVCTMVGSGELAQTTTQFADVPSSHWASGYVAYATQAGYTNGYSATQFGPEDPVTYEQVVKLVTCTLGYEIVAKSNGGWPTGYLMIAADKQITKNAPGKGPDAAPRATAAILVYNALNSPILSRTTYGVNQEWSFMDGTNGNALQTLLNVKLHAYKVEGTVMATPTSQATSSLKTGYVNFHITNTLGIDPIAELGGDDEKVNKSNPLIMNNIDASGTDAADLLYYMSTAYIQEQDNTGDFAIISIVSKFGRNVRYEINDASQIYDPAEDSIYGAAHPADVFALDAPNGSQKFVYSYWKNRDEDTRMVTQEVDPSAYVIWNGQVRDDLATVATYVGANATPFDEAGNWRQNLVRPLVGTVKLIDIDNDGKIDVIDSRNYEVGVVEDINVDNKSVVFKEASRTVGGRIILSDEEHADLKTISITLDGKAIELKDLKEYDVLNICSNDFNNPTFFEIIVTRDVVEGVVTEHNPSRNTYTVGDSDPLSISKSVTSAFDIELEDEGSFYLDMNGNIAYVDSISVINGNFSYLYQIGVNGWDDWQLRMFDKAGQNKSYDIYDRVKINGVSTKTLDTAFTQADIVKIFEDSAANLNVTGNTVADIMATPGGYAAGEGVTPKIFLHALVGKDVGTKAAPTFKPEYLAAMAGDVKTNRLVDVTTSETNGVTSIKLALFGPSETKAFTYVGTPTAAEVEWNATTGKFVGSKTIASEAKVFFIPDGKTIADYKVTDISMLQHEASYKPYFFNNTDDGISLVLLFSDGDVMGNYAVFSSFVSTSVDGDNAKKITYYEGGSKSATQLAALDSEVEVEGIKNSIAAMRAGDVFSYSKDSKGNVVRVHVMFSPGTVAPGVGIAFNSLIDLGVAGGSFDKWDIYNVNTPGKDTSADHELYFGIVNKVASSSGGKKINIINQTGLLSSEETFSVPSSAKVTTYFPARSESKVLSSGSIADITASFCLKDAAGNFDLTDTSKDLTYALVKMYKDDVVEVLYISYSQR